MLTRQNQGSLGASYWRMTSQDDRLPRGVSICLVVVVCASLRMLLSCLVPARGRFFRSWCLRAGVGALLRLHGRWSWLPSPGVVSGRCSVRLLLACLPLPRLPLACRSFMSVSRASPSGAAPSTRVPCGGVCTTRGCDTPATRRQRASCSAKPPSHQIGDRAGRNSRRRRCGVRGIVWARLLTKVPPHQGASSPRCLLTKWPPHQGVAKATSPQISHAIPRRCESTQAQKPRNFNDPTSKPETFSGELHAKSLDPALSTPRKVARNSFRASFGDSSKTA